MEFVDIHPHVISHDHARYPLDPVGGKLSTWARERPVDAGEMIAAMDAAGIARAVLVHASTAYGYDNRYVADTAAAHPERFLFVGAIDVTATDAAERVDAWAARGMAGFRIFGAGSTMEEGTGDWLDDPRTFPAWDRASDLGLPVCVQTWFSMFPRLRTLLERYPSVPVILDHCAHPPVADGPPYAAAAELFALSGYPNLYLKLTEHNFSELAAGSGVRPFVAKLVETFGARRIAWGSNFPGSPGTLAELRDLAARELAFLPEEDRRAIFSETALTLYPGLRRLGAPR